MNLKIISLAFVFALSVSLHASVSVDDEALGKSLGGWTKRGGKSAEYPLSGANYRTYRPEITPTPDGGIFISLRIDHVRGWLSSDDHAILEVTVNSKGRIISAQSSIAIQGRSVSSDLIRAATGAGQELAGVDRAVQIGTDLVADISAKMLREKIVEAGRVSYPAVLRHNYNLLFQSIRAEQIPQAVVVGPTVNEKPAKPAAPKSKPFEIKPYGTVGKPELPVQEVE